MNRTTVGMIAAALWVTACLVVEHFAGIYQPSETTGRMSNLGGLLGSFILIGWIAGSQGSEVPATLLRRFGRGLAVALAAALALGLAKYLYFSLVWGDFSGRMAEFTEATLRVRGDDVNHIRSFVASVRESWRTPNIVANSFLMFFVWGGVFALLVAALATGINRLRAKLGAKSL